MLLKKLFGIVLLLVLLTGFISRPAGLGKNVSKWVISESGTLRVTGSTNVNKFACEITSYATADTLIMSKGSNGVNLSGTICLDIAEFDCHHLVMTRDLRKTLKEKQYPMMQIAFLNLNEMPDFNDRNCLITGMVEITLAGVRKKMEVRYQVLTDAKHNLTLTGFRDINFSDFGLMPPEKFNGMVRTKEKLGIVFQLKLSPAGKGV